MFLLEGIDKHASDFHDKLFFILEVKNVSGLPYAFYYYYLGSRNESHRLTWSVLESLNCQEPCLPGCHQAYNMDKFQNWRFFQCFGTLQGSMQNPSYLLCHPKFDKYKMNQQNRLEDLCFMFQRTFQTGQYEGVETKGDVVVPWRSLLTLI